MSRADLRAASYWQFMEMVDGWTAAHVPNRKEGLSADEEGALWELASLSTEE
ncbi:MAG TPA: hypothetical protein VGN91_00525 [Bosea sp. (in: a-proteobacteria)]|jgi:hypothetical protein|nr:hypothetical protein [Bosea sp. (in: a-proteobacteria)]